MTRQLTLFVFGWRGFLVGGRRTWHAHHRWGVVGHRGGVLVVSAAVQSGQLAAFAGVTAEVFARGGTAWVAGASGPPGRFLWGRVFPSWRPGVLSNYFFSRLRRTHFVRATARVWHPRRPSRRRLVRRVSVRAGRLRRDRGGLYTQTAARSAGAASIARLGRSARPGGYAVYPGGPAAGRGRTGWFRAWWVRSVRLVSASAPGRVGFRSGRPGAARAVIHRLAVRSGRPRPVTPAGWVLNAVPPRATQAVCPTRGVPTRGGARHGRWPISFPAILVGAGLGLLRSTLLNEVNSSGVLFVRFGGVDFAPRVGLIEVFWNPTAAGAGGVPGLLRDFFVRSARTGLFRVFWRRLCVSV